MKWFTKTYRAVRYIADMSCQASAQKECVFLKGPSRYAYHRRADKSLALLGRKKVNVSVRMV